MKSSLLLTLFALLLLQACKKDDEADSPPSISFSSTGGYTLNLPLTVVFTANSPGAESISWDFGDGTFGQGFSVQHSYTAYGNYKVKATASKAGLSSTYIRDLPVTFHRRAVIKQLEIVQVPTFRPGGLDWDPGNLPDLSFKITFPGDTVYQSNTVLNNAESGLFNIVPAKGTFSFDQDIRFDIYDIDTGNVPDRENMGILKFRFCNVLPLSSTYTDSVQLNSGALRIKLKFEFQL